jgi:predicted outer membrane protein
MRDRFATMTVTTLLAAAAAVAACSTRSRDTNEAAGEVVVRSSADTANARPAVRWLTDANILSLLGVMNSRQVAAADVELESWHVDSVRAFAATVAREHAEFQHSVDSLAEQIHVAPIAPALAQTISATMQSQIDLLRRNYGHALDRVFIREQVASYQLMAEDLSEFAADAEHPEVQSLLSSARDSMTAQLARARALQTRLFVADSTVAADSAAKLAAKAAARRARQLTTP